MNQKLMIRLSPVIATLGLFLFWDLICVAFKLPSYLLPRPLEVFQAMYDFWPALMRESLYTLATTMVGFGIAVVAGLALGVFIGWSPAIYAGVYPLMVAFNAVPKVAIVPILVLWFGIGAVPAALTAFLISFFPIVVNVATGLATIEAELVDVLKALGASRMDIMRRVGIPRAMPYFFGSLKISITLAFVGSVLAETIASNNGIGKFMLMAQAQFQVPLIFASLIVLGAMGIVMYVIMAIIEKRTTGWAHRGDHN